MGVLGLVIANNLFEIAGAIGIGFVCYKVGVMRGVRWGRKHPVVETL